MGGLLEVQWFCRIREAENGQFAVLGALAGCSAKRSERRVASHTSEEQRRDRTGRLCASLAARVSGDWGRHSTPEKVNGKTKGIKGVPGHLYASARSPTVTFDNENKSTPYRTAPAKRAISDRSSN